MTSFEQTINYYNKKAALYVGDTRDIDFSPLQNEFASYVKKGGRIIDLGCGSGRDSKAFIGMGFDVVSIDGSSEICNLAKAYIGRNVICSTFQNFETQGSYDGIWACASLLHLPIDELKNVLKKFTKSLNDGGVFYLSFKYGTFSGERNGRHFTDMNEDSFLDLIGDIPELKIIKQNISQDVRKGRDSEKWLNVFLKKC